MSSIEDECEQTIDVREIEGEPFGEIMAALEGLGAEDRLHLVSAFEPVPLYEVLSDRGFGHGFSTRYEVQQGTVHGIVAPAVLEYVFDQTDGRRHVIAESLGITTEGKSTEAVAEAIVSKVTSIRNELGLPSQLRSIEGLEKSHLPPIAEEIETDPWLEENSPSGLDRSKDTIEEILNDIW